MYSTHVSNISSDNRQIACFPPNNQAQEVHASSEREVN